MQSNELIGKVPPYNEEAESATLGALLLDSESIDVVLNHLRSGDFYKKANQIIFQTIIDLYNTGGAVDILTVSESLRKADQLSVAGGPGYVSSLTSEVPSSANVEYYAKIVSNMSIRRKMLKIAGEIQKDAFDMTSESRMIIEDAERKIFEITDDQHSGAFSSAKEIITETIDGIEKLYHTKESFTGIPSGLPDLDQMTSGFQKSELVIIGARPSVGKTAFALTLAGNIAIHHKIPVGFFTLEMSNKAMMQRILSSEARLDSNKLRTGMLKPADFHNITEAASRIYEAPLYLDDTPNIKLLDLRAQARRMKAKADIQILFIDYLTLISSENPALPRHEQVAEISRSLKSLARELDIPVVTLSQVSRDSEGKKPNLANLRESGSIEQDADVVLFLHRDRGIERGRDDGAPNLIETELIIAKQRNGPVGTVEIAFLPHYTKFESMSRMN
ncbi:replicative DNA helicase [Spirochaeta cellobiosiphila]|uniref:replicative DNA helicase n=1 Tax=Spirochaeta cellobiosiphila TaxID=504483 RepID=UPI0004904E07|nr:replicative DNA helicase [Spirochaeta cellobiosiphila]